MDDRATATDLRPAESRSAPDAASPGARSPDDGASPDDVGDAPSPQDPSTFGQIADSVESAAGTVAQVVTHTTASLVRGATELAADAARRFEDRPGANARRQREAARRPLPVLWDVHPEALNAQRHDLGLLAVPVEQIRGTAVEGAQRAGDFKPIRSLRGSNWEGRWQRLRTAVNRLAVLPPVELLKTGDEYWVVDGHNRVAMAREVGQVAIDASVVELPLPGGSRPHPSASIGSFLAEDMHDLRAAGEGRHSRTAGPAVDLEDTELIRRTFDPEHADEAHQT